MAKSFTLLSNDIASALRLNTLTKEAPHVIELNKLFEMLEKLLKKPLDPINSETTLNEYYNKLSKLTNLLNSLNRKEVITTTENDEETLNSSNISNTSSTITTPSKSSTIMSPSKSSINNQNPITSTPISNTLFQTPQNITSVVSSSLPSTITSSQSPIPTNISPEKQQLLGALYSADQTFAYDPTTKHVHMLGKKYDLTEFNSLFSKLRDVDSKLKKSKTLSSPSEKEMFDVIKNILTQQTDGTNIINKLPGLKQYFNDLTPKAKTRARGKLQSPPISANSPVSTFRQFGRSKSADTTPKKKLSSTSGSGNLFGATKINFKRWEEFQKCEFISIQKTINRKNYFHEKTNIRIFSFQIPTKDSNLTCASSFDGFINGQTPDNRLLNHPSKDVNIHNFHLAKNTCVKTHTQ